MKTGIHYLVTTKCCPNCKVIKSELSKNNLSYIELTVEEGLPDWVNVQTAPTLLFKKDEASNVETYSGIGEIVPYIRNIKK